MRSWRPSATAATRATHSNWYCSKACWWRAISAAQRGIQLCQSLLRAQLGQRVNVMILEKALTLELQHFEDSEFYDKLTRARREASTRPLSLVIRTFFLVQNGISLISYGALLAHFSPWAVVVLLAAGLPAFVAEAKFSGDAFRLFRWRSPETRMQIYLETVLAREDHVKEVKLFGLGARLLDRYREDLRTSVCGGPGAHHPARCVGICARPHRLPRALRCLRLDCGEHGAPTDHVGQMTMYVALFRQGQSTVTAILTAIGGMYEDNLYLSTLYEYLETEVLQPSGTALHGPHPEDGIRFEDVSFTYPEADGAGAAEHYAAPRAGHESGAGR